MGAVGWFLIGFFVAQAIGLITTTTPERAKQNLQEWMQLFRGTPTVP